MTHNFFVAALILVVLHLFLLDGWVIRVGIIACVILGLLSGYGVLPAWQG